MNGFPFGGVEKESNGKPTSKSYEGDFDEIEVSESINATLIKSDLEKVVIHAPSDVIDYIVVENKGGKLSIYVESNIRLSMKNIRADIYAKDFTSLEANSSATINLKDKFVQEKVEISASSSGSVFGSLEANDLKIESNSSGEFSGKIWAINLDMEASSSGSISVSGNSKNGKLEANSSGSISAQNLEIQNLEAESSSSGSITANVTQTLNAEANSSGSITISTKGNLAHQIINKSTGGSVTIN